MKRVILLLAAVWLMLGFVMLHTATAADEPCTMYVHVREGTFLNGRNSPNLDGQIMMRMGRGFEVNVFDVKNGWALIEGGEAGTCWCCVDYLASYQPDDIPPKYVVVSNGRVRIRRSPNGKATGKYVRDGNEVTVRFIIDGWAYIGSGYIAAEYIKEVQDEH